MNEIENGYNGGLSNIGSIHKNGDDSKDGMSEMNNNSNVHNGHSLEALVIICYNGADKNKLKLQTTRNRNKTKTKSKSKSKSKHKNKEKEKDKEIEIDKDRDNTNERRFRTVSSLITLIEICYDYLECGSRLPPISKDVADRLIEIFRFFNSKTCQLVLGAGAMQLVGLSSITAKHLALAYQSIWVIIELVPFVRLWFDKILAANCVPLISNEFDRLNEDLYQHSKEIEKKLISIMQGLIKQQFRSYSEYLKKKAHKSSSDVKIHDSIAQLMKQCRQMYRVLGLYLGNDEISNIFDPIIEQFIVQLKYIIQQKKVDLKNNLNNKNNNINNSNNNNNNNDNEKTNDYDDKNDKLNKKNKNKNKNGLNRNPKINYEKSFHSLNMTIRYISERLERLNCDASEIAGLCVDDDDPDFDF